MINWKRLGEAVEFYKSKGYVYIDTPWMVNAQATRATFDGYPHTVQSHGKPKRHLVGSAEQGFLELYRAGDKLVPGQYKYVSCGPCFRNEEVLDHLHQETFMKVELFVVVPHGHGFVEIRDQVISHVISFIGPYCEVVRSCPSSYDMDINVNGEEIGSYGVRKLPRSNHSYVYGTGLAEPRMSRVLCV